MKKKIEDLLRAVFTKMHNGRYLKQHPLRGTYSSPPIAALWNQHKRTAEWFDDLLSNPKWVITAEGLPEKDRQVVWIVCTDRPNEVLPAVWSTHFAHFGWEKGWYEQDEVLVWSDASLHLPNPPVLHQRTN